MNKLDNNTDKPNPANKSNGWHSMPPRQRRRFALLVSIMTFLWLMVVVGSTTNEVVKVVPLGEVLSAINDGKATSASIDDAKRVVTIKIKGQETSIRAAYPEGYVVSLTDSINAQSIKLIVEPVPQPSFLSSMFSLLLPILLLAGLFIWLNRRGAAGMQGLGKLSSKKTSPVEPPKTKFSDVAGLDETVDELREIVSLIENPERYTNLGARASRGFLLVGPPGTGKTLLAKAVAGEAGVPFFALSGSDFTEMFVGVGASRVRELFAKARAAAPAIIFVDEIDSVARQRGGNGFGTNDERENTLNQLLAELDGFESNNVIFIAATNRVDILDPALLRPGRFDRKIIVPLPDRQGREDILRVHAAGKPFAAKVALSELAKRTPGFSGADLAYLVNEAALEAARRGAEEISEDDLQSALATSVLGKARKNALVTERDRTIVAWHEAGHATAALIEENAADPVTVTIIPRGGAGGVTWMGGSDDSFLTRSQALSRLVVSMAGRGAEKILLQGDYTQGAHGDLSSATQVATEMISRYGMGSRLVSMENFPGTIGADRIADEASTLITDASKKSDILLKKHRNLLETIANRLLDKETLDGAELRELADKHITGKLPKIKSRKAVGNVPAP